MKKIVLLILLFVSFVTPAQAANDPALVAKVEAYLNALTTFSADFTQVDESGGVSGGKFYLKRPGKFKWEYDKRQPILIVSDGKQLVYYDKELKEVSYASPEDTLASFLSRKTIKLSGDVSLVNIQDVAGFVSAKVVQAGKADQGSLTMYFSSIDMKLVKLEVTDVNGSLTQITFSNEQFGQQISDKTFIFQNPRYQGNAWERK